MDERMENRIIESVLKELRTQGVVKADLKGTEEAPVTLEPKEHIGVENPHNMATLKRMRGTSPARILMGRSGPRQRTGSLLNFLADHAAAADAVFTEVAPELLEEQGLFMVQTMAESKDRYLMQPELGRKLSEEARETILEHCPKGKQVQVIVADGLSSTAIEANLADVLPAFMQGLKMEGIEAGRPFFVKYGRVGVQDEIARLLDCDVIVELVGERPGLTTAESMSAYIIYRPHEKTVEADRTVISNIHRGGTPPAEAGAHMATVVKRILDNKASGVRLSELLKKKTT